MGKNKSYVSSERQEKYNNMADHLDEYVDAVESLFILEGKRESDVDDAIKIVRKAAKDLRKGKVDKVFSDEYDEDEELYDE